MRSTRVATTVASTDSVSDTRRRSTCDVATRSATTAAKRGSEPRTTLAAAECASGQVVMTVDESDDDQPASATSAQERCCRDPSGPVMTKLRSVATALPPSCNADRPRMRPPAARAVLRADRYLARALRVGEPAGVVDHSQVRCTAM